MSTIPLLARNRAACDCGIRFGSYVNGVLVMRAQDGAFSFRANGDGMDATCRKGHTTWHPNRQLVDE
jgi:hypothetical protein